jgi:hypothetical protein
VIGVPGVVQVAAGVLSADLSSGKRNKEKHFLMWLVKSELPLGKIDYLTSN